MRLRFTAIFVVTVALFGMGDSLDASFELVRDGLRAWRFGDMDGASYLLDKGRAELLSLRPEVRSRDDVARTSLYLGQANLFIALISNDDESFRRAYRHFFSLAKMGEKPWSSEGGYYSGIGYILHNGGDRILDLSRALTYFESIILKGGDYRREDSKIMLGLTYLLTADAKLNSGDRDVRPELISAIRSVDGMTNRRAARIRDAAEIGLATLSLRDWLSSKDLYLADSLTHLDEARKHAGTVLKSADQDIATRAKSILLVTGMNNTDLTILPGISSLPFLATGAIDPRDLRDNLYTQATDNRQADFYLGWLAVLDDNYVDGWHHFKYAEQFADDSALYAHAAFRAAATGLVLDMLNNGAPLVGQSSPGMETILDPWSQLSHWLPRRTLRCGRTLLLQSEYSDHFPSDSTSLCDAIHDIGLTPEQTPLEYMDMARFIVERYSFLADSFTVYPPLEYGFNMLNRVIETHKGTDTAELAKLFSGMYRLYMGVYHPDNYEIDDARTVLRTVGGSYRVEAELIEAISYIFANDMDKGNKLLDELISRGNMRAAFIRAAFLDDCQEKADALRRVQLTIVDDDPDLATEIDNSLTDLDCKPRIRILPYPNYVPTEDLPTFEEMMTSIESGYYIVNPEIRKLDLWYDWAFTLPLYPAMELEGFVRW